MRNLSRVAVLLLIFFWLGAVGTFSTNFIFAAEKIDINIAPIEDLIKIIHIGETRAKELISLRPFSSLDELTKIKGIGEVTSLMEKAGGILNIDLDIDREAALDFRDKIENAGVSSFYLGKKGLAYVSNIRV